MAPNVPYPQRLALDLDGLVRTLAAGGEQAESAAAAAAEALAGAWNDAGRVGLVNSGVALAINDKVALRAGDEDGTWLLPAAAAGLRGIRPRVALTSTICLQLGRALAGLDRSAAAVSAFRAWLRAGGSGAFELECGPCLADRVDGVSPEEGARRSVDADRARFVQAKTMAFARRMQTRDMLREQADARMNGYIAALGDGTIALDAAAVEALRLGAEDGRFWARQLAATVTTSDGRLARVRPEQASGRARAARPPAPPPAAAAAIEGLHDALGGGDAGAGEPATGEPGAEGEGGEAATAEGPRDIPGWLRALRREIDDLSLGKAVGRGVGLDQETVQRLTMMVRDVATPFSVGVATGVLERAAGGEVEVKRVAAVCQAVGLTALWSRAELAGLNERTARGIAHVLKLADAGADAYADLVVACPATVAAWILRNAPPHVRSRIETRLRQVFRSRDPTENTPLVEALIAGGSPSSMKALGEVLLQTRGEGWAGRIVPDLCAAIVRARLGGDFLVPLFRDREADTKLRLLVLRSLEGHDDLLAEATKRRMTDLMEPKEIQARLKAVRDRIKG